MTYIDVFSSKMFQNLYNVINMSLITFRLRRITSRYQDAVGDSKLRPRSVPLPGELDRITVSDVRLLTDAAIWRTARNIRVVSSLILTHSFYMKTRCHQQNRRYKTYCIAVRGPSHGPPLAPYLKHIQKI